MRSIILCFCLTILSLGSFCQKSVDNLIDVQNSVRARKLAIRLTGKLNNDSEKIQAIHSWITHNIKYDVNKYLKNDYSHVSTQTIIRTKKATCVGYSDLFTELCSHCSITSVNVAGYIKNRFTDLDDKMYLDEHMWNAVKLNGEWKLVDACWDAGYINNLKKTFRGKLKYLLTFGKQTIYKREMHFVGSASDFYFLRSGEFFKTDHLPLNPMWQLTDKVISMPDWETDSSFFLHKYDLTNDSLLTVNNKPALTEYAFRSEKEKFIMDGIAGNNYNKKNNLIPGNSYRILAQEKIEDAGKQKGDSSTRIKFIDEAFSNLDSAAAYFVLNDSFLQIQEKELLQKNDLKKNIFDSINGTLSSSTIKIINATQDNKTFFRQNKKEAYILIENSKRKIKAFNKEKPISEMKFSKRSNERDSTMLAEQINILTEIENGLYDSLKYYYRYLDTLYIHCHSRALSHSGIKKNLINRAKMLVTFRLKFDDDLDYNIISFRDSFYTDKMRCDSLLFFNDTSIFKYMDLKTKIAEDQVSHIYSIYHSKLVKLRKLKTKCSENDSIDVDYERSVNELVNILDEFEGYQADWINMCNDMIPLSKTADKLATKELEIYTEEKETEQNNSDERIFQIKNRHAGYQKLNKQAQTATISMRTKANKIMRKIRK